MSVAVAEAAYDFQEGVSVPWLAMAFGMSEGLVRKRLRGCQPISKKTSGHLYSLADAASYLVSPRMDILNYVRTMNPKDLPPELQTAVWRAQRQRQEWEKEAGELWDHKEVVSFLVLIFSHVRESVLRWPDTVSGQIDIDDELRTTLERLGDELLDRLGNEIEDLARQQSPQSILSRLSEVLDTQPDDDVVADLF